MTQPRTEQNSVLPLLLKHGWAVLSIQSPQAGAFCQALLDLARTLGEPVGTRTRALVDELRPQLAHEVLHPSLSAQVGHGLQPWHMDMAHRMEPARFLVMGMYECPTETAPTELLDATALVPKALTQEAQCEPFLVRTGARSFYATILTKDQPFVRFDPGCMQGSTPRASALMQQLLAHASAPTHVHQWSAGSVLVINNWKMLHRRADATNSTNRTLYRVSVMGGTA